MNPNPFQHVVPPQVQQNNVAIKQQIISNLRSQQCPAGWQQTFRIENRANFVHQITTQLFLVKPDMTEQKALEVAFDFERREFCSSPDEDAYRKNCRTKLSKIAQARQKQANMQNQRRLHDQAPQGFGGQQQQMFQPPLLQMNEAQNMARLQQAQIQQQQMPNTARMQQGFPTMQPTMNMPQQSYLNQASQGLTPEELKHIQGRAQQMAIDMTDQQRMEVARKVKSIPDHIKLRLDQQGMNPIQAYVQQQATVNYRHEKARAMMMQQAQGMPMISGGAVQPQPTSQSGIPAQGLTPQQLSQMVRAGNVNQQILAQQQEALRRQQAGQVVVPGNPGHGVSGIPQAPQQQQPTQQQQQQHQQQQQQQQQQHQQQQQQQQQQGRPNPAWQTHNQGAFQQHQQSLWNNFQDQQMSQSQPQAPTPNLAVGGQQPGLRGQMGGLNGNQNMKMGQQTPAMPTLNQPLGTPGQSQYGLSPRPVQPNTPFPQGIPQPGADGQPKSAVNQKANQERFKSLPPQIQQQLAKLPSDAARKQFMMSMQAKQQEMKLKQNAQTTGGMTRGPQAGIQSQQPSHSGGIANNQNSQSEQAVASGLAQGGNPGLHQPNTMNQMSQTPQIAGQHPNQVGMPPNPILNDEQTRFMDGLDFPRGILNNKSTFGKMPESAKTWGELKRYVAQNARFLPNGTLRKVGELQAQAYHLTVVPQLSQQRQRGPPQQANTAPTAQMVPANQAPSQNISFDNVRMQPLPQPTLQDIQTLRARLSANAQSMSDDQIRSVIMSKRHQAPPNAAGQNIVGPNTAGQHPQASTHQQQIQYNNMLRAQQYQQTQNQVPVPQIPQSQQQQRKTPQNRQPVQKPVQANMNHPVPVGQGRQAMGGRTAAQPTAKNLKRNNNSSTNDDVVEIADPKLSKQAQPNKVPQPSQMPGSLPLTQQQFEAMTEQQKAQYMAQRSRQMQGIQNGQAPAPLARPNNDPAKGKQEMEQASMKVRAILAELHGNLGRRPSAPMSPKTRGSMIQKIRESQPMAQRVEMALTLLFRMRGEDDSVKEMARMHLLLREQVRDSSFNPIENFTVSADELDQILQKLKDQCAYVLSRVAPHQRGAASNQVQSQKSNLLGVRSEGDSQTQQQFNANAQPQKLTAESLQQQQDAIQRSRAASLQKNQGIIRTPDAPTTAHAPFPFGQLSPQGVPVMYNPKNELTQKDLVLPVAKRRKANQTSAASTPAQAIQATASQSSPVSKVESPESQRVPSRLATKLRCTVPDCKSRSPFVSIGDLDKHMAEVHPPKEEEITDPLAYCLEGFRMILNLDDDGKARCAVATSVENVQSSVIKKAPSTQGQNTKQETATPMSRNLTGAGPSPSATLLKTPQPSVNVKTPASDVKSAVSGSRNASKPAEMTAIDAWSDTKINKDWFPAVFGDVTDLSRPVSAFLGDWAARNPFSLVADGSSGSSKQSPNASDISANDELSIDLTGNTGDNSWIPSDWLDDGLSADLAASVLDPVLGMDWDAAFGGDESDDKDVVTGKDRKRDEADPSDEFMRVYAPEKLEDRKKTELEKRR